MSQQPKAQSGPVARTPVPVRQEQSPLPPIVPDNPTAFQFPPARSNDVDLAAMIRGMEERLGGKMDNVEGKVISLERRMDRGDDEFEAKVLKVINSQKSQSDQLAIGSAPTAGNALAIANPRMALAPPNPQASRADMQEMLFYEHRRALSAGRTSRSASTAS